MCTTPSPPITAHLGTARSSSAEKPRAGELTVDPSPLASASISHLSQAGSKASSALTAGTARSCPAVLPADLGEAILCAGPQFPTCVMVALGPWLLHDWLWNEKLTVRSSSWGHLCIGATAGLLSPQGGHRAKEGTQASSGSTLLLPQCLGGRGRLTGLAHEMGPF